MAAAVADGSAGPALRKVFGTGGGGTVVKRQDRSAAIGFPRTSATPAGPPLTVTV